MTFFSDSVFDLEMEKWRKLALLARGTVTPETLKDACYFSWSGLDTTFCKSLHSWKTGQIDRSNRFVRGTTEKFRDSECSRHEKKTAINQLAFFCHVHCQKPSEVSLNFHEKMIGASDLGWLIPMELWLLNPLTIRKMARFCFFLLWYHPEEKLKQIFSVKDGFLRLCKLRRWYPAIWDLCWNCIRSSCCMMFQTQKSTFFLFCSPLPSHISPFFKFQHALVCFPPNKPWRSEACSDLCAARAMNQHLPLIPLFSSPFQYPTEPFCSFPSVYNSSHKVPKSLPYSS